MINPVNINFKLQLSNSQVSNPTNANPYLTAPNSVMAKPVQKNFYNPFVSNNAAYDIKVPLKYTKLKEIPLTSELKAHLYKLENGQTVAVVPKKGPTVVKTYVNSGSMNESDDIRGISHFIEHNLFNGSDGLEAGEFFKTVNNMGANTNASTSFAITDYYVASNLLKKDDFDKSVKIHASMLQSPKFALDMLEKEKGPVTSEINMILDNPFNLAINRSLKTLYNINSKSEDIIAGTVSNINSMNREKVIDYYNKNYYPSNMYTVISGEVSPEEAISTAAKYFKNDKHVPIKRYYEPLNPLEKTVRKDIISDKATSTIISMAFNGPENADSKSKFVEYIVSNLLLSSNSSRLTSELEKFQADASLESEKISTKLQDGKVLLLTSETSENKSENVLKSIYKVVSELYNTPPTAKELDIAKSKLKKSMGAMFEYSSSVNSYVGNALLNNRLEHYADYDKIIDSITAQDVSDFAKKYLNLNKAAITVIHPKSADVQAISSNYKQSNNISFTGNSAQMNKKQALNPENVKMYRLQNGMIVATQNSENNSSSLLVDFATYAPANVKPGVADVLNLMINRGTQFKDEKAFTSELEDKGIDISVDVNERGFFVSSEFSPEKSAEAVKLVKEVVMNPRFTQENLDFAKNLIREVIQNLPIEASEGLNSELFKGQIYGYTSSELLKNLDTIKLEDVISLHKYFMDNSKATSVYTAPVDKNNRLLDSVLTDMSYDFPTFKKNSPSLFKTYVPVDSKKIVVKENNNNQAEILMGYKYHRNGNLRDSVNTALLNSILGGTPSSRLFSDLREKQKLAYRVSSRTTGYDNAGVIILSIKTTTDNPQTGEIKYDNLQKSIEGFEHHVKKLMTEEVTEEELENAKLDLKNSVLNSNETLYGQANSVLGGISSYYGPSIDNQVLDLIDTITVKDIKSAANYLFNSNPVISIVASKNTIDNNKEYLRSKGKLITE